MFSCTREDAGDKAVVWPVLTGFDALALRSASLAQNGGLPSLREARSELIVSGQAVTAETIPSNASDPQQVETVLADLSSLIEGLSTEGDDESHTTLVMVT